MPPSFMQYLPADVRLEMRAYIAGLPSPTSAFTKALQAMPALVVNQDTVCLHHSVYHEVDRCAMCANSCTPDTCWITAAEPYK